MDPRTRNPNAVPKPRPGNRAKYIPQESDKPAKKKTTKKVRNRDKGE